MIAFTSFAEGRPFEAVPRRELDRLNAVNGTEYATCPQPDTIQFIRAEAALAAEQVRRLSDESLAREGLYIADGQNRSVLLYIERVLIGHIRMHEQTIREALGLAAPV